LATGAACRYECAGGGEERGGRAGQDGFGEWAKNMVLGPVGRPLHFSFYLNLFSKLISNALLNILKEFLGVDPNIKFSTTLL
jgi:hypothetical protein